MESVAESRLRNRLAQRFNLSQNDFKISHFEGVMTRDMKALVCYAPLTQWATRIGESITLDQYIEGFPLILEFVRESDVNPKGIEILLNVQKRDSTAFERTTFARLTQKWKPLKLRRIQMYTWFIVWKHYRDSYLALSRKLTPTEYQRELRRIQAGISQDDYKIQSMMKPLNTRLNANQRKLEPALAQLHKYQSLVSELMESRNEILSEIFEVNPGFSAPVVAGHSITEEEESMDYLDPTY